MAFGISGDGTSPAEECDSGMDVGSTTAAQGFGTPISMDAAVSQRRCCFNISLQDGMSNRLRLMVAFYTANRSDVKKPGRWRAAGCQHGAVKLTLVL
jgi:hypothetical protein